MLTANGANDAVNVNHLGAQSRNRSDTKTPHATKNALSTTQYHGDKLRRRDITSFWQCPECRDRACADVANKNPIEAQAFEPHRPCPVLHVERLHAGRSADGFSDAHENTVEALFRQAGPPASGTLSGDGLLSPDRPLGE